MKYRKRHTVFQGGDLIVQRGCPKGREIEQAFKVDCVVGGYILAYPFSPKPGGMIPIDTTLDPRKFKLWKTQEEFVAEKMME